MVDDPELAEVYRDSAQSLAVAGHAALDDPIGCREADARAADQGRSRIRALRASDRSSSTTFAHKVLPLGLQRCQFLRP